MNLYQTSSNHKYLCRNYILIQNYIKSRVTALYTIPNMCQNHLFHTRTLRSCKMKMSSIRTKFIQPCLMLPNGPLEHTRLHLTFHPNAIGLVLSSLQTCRARRICSLVWGIGPSGAETTSMPPSICAAPVIIFCKQSHFQYQILVH